MTTHYQTLGIPEGSGAEHVRDSWLLLVQAFHPDKFPQGSKAQRQAEERLKAINAAYDVLKDPARRAAYDAERTGYTPPYARPSQPPPQAEPKRSTQAYSPYNDEWKGAGPYCPKCGTPLNATSYCPSCEKFREPSATTPINPSQPKKSSGGLGFITGYAYLIGIVMVFAAMRVIWVALVASITLFVLLYFRKFFGYRRGAYIVALIISCGFIVADFLYPSEESKSTAAASKDVIYDGKYSDSPCDASEMAQGHSNVDHRPCRPKQVEITPDAQVDFKPSEVEIRQPKSAAPKDAAFREALEYCKTAPVTSGFCYDNGFVPATGSVVRGEKGVRYYCPGAGQRCEPLINDGSAAEGRSWKECVKAGVCKEAKAAVKGER
jgi:hypothetical protein